MAEVLLDQEVSTRYACFAIHDSDGRCHGLRGDDDDLVVETNGGVSILLGDQDSTDEVLVRARVVRAPAADAAGEVVFTQRMFLYGTGLVLDAGHSTREDHAFDLGGPGRVDVRVHLERDAVPPAVTVVIGELEPDRSVLPPRSLGQVFRDWRRRRAR
jgi:hypothetical protein